MAKLPQVNGDRLLRALQKAGWEIDRTRGSHFILVHQRDSAITVTVPVHRKTVKPGTLAAILKSAGISPERLRELI